MPRSSRWPSIRKTLAAPAPLRPPAEQAPGRGAKLRHHARAKSRCCCLSATTSFPPAISFSSTWTFTGGTIRRGDVAVVGRIQWPKDLRATPFMHFVNDHGAQFGFAAMNHPGPWQFDCFYTSNISVPRQMLVQLDYVFDEDFKTYGWEDTELGYRLERNGMRLLYNPDAVADHDHPTDLVRFCRRQYQVGMCSRVFLAKHPELESHLGSMRRRCGGRATLATAMEGPGAAWPTCSTGTSALPLPRRWYWAFLTTSYARGVVDGEATFRPQRAARTNGA